MAEMQNVQLEALRALGESYAHRRHAVLGELLGFGGSAAVYRMKTSAGNVALKIYLPSFLQGDQGLSERRRITLQEGLIGHPCKSLVQFLRIDFEEDTCFIQMEFFAWQDLSKCLSDIPRTAIYPLLGQLVSAARFLDSRGLVHRDIKPANILVSPTFDQLVLIDLGVVREATADEDRPDGTDHGNVRPFIATNQYSSPEYLFRTAAPSPSLWHALTIYQIGGVLHDLIARRPLFYAEVQTANRYAVAYAVQQRLPNFDEVDDVPASLKLLALRCLSKSPERRVRFVQWDDFSPPTNDIAGVRKRLAALRATGVHQSVEQQEVLKTSMARRDFAHDIFEAVFGALREQFNAGTVIEQIPFDDTSQRILYRCHFEDLSWVVDCSFEFSWPEGSEDSGVQPDILAGARLARSQSQAVHSADRLIGVASPKSGNTHATVEIFVGQTTKFLAQALAILEVGEPNSEPQILE